MELVTSAPVFLRIEVDCCGPFNVQQGSRKTAPIKCYLSVFVCLIVKAVHVEMDADLTTEAFMAALRRFVARRASHKLSFVTIRQILLVRGEKSPFSTIFTTIIKKIIKL